MIPSHIFCHNCGAENQAQDVVCFACGQPVQADPAIPISVAVPATGVTTGLLAPGSLLNQRYRIHALIGQGGMAAVYAAEDRLSHDRLVAVKEMNPDRLSAKEVVDAIETLHREASLLADLSHPSFPAIHDAFLEGGRWYLVMDLIDGESLETYVNAKGGSLEVLEVVDMGIQLAEALQYLHHRQPPLIFRDLKPANIMRRRDGHLFLIDFGIARQFKPGQAKDTIPFGSVGYAAPEQYGKAQTTPRSDIYSLGAVLHQLLTGDDPSLTPFTFAPMAKRVPAVPANLERLVLHMVARDAALRPASMEIVLRELSEIAESATPHALFMPLPGVSFRASVNPPAGSSASKGVAASAKPLPMQQRRRGTISRRKAMGGIGVSVIGMIGGDIVFHALFQVMTFSRTPPQTAAHPVATIPSSLVRSAPLFVYQGHAYAVTAVAWAPNGRRIASGSADATVQVWNASNGANALVYRGHTYAVEGVAWSPAGKRIVSCGEDGTILEWDAESGTTLVRAGVVNGADAIAWSPEGSRVAGASPYWTVTIMDAADGTFLFTYQGHTASVNAVAWSPVGRRVASGSADETVQLWNAADGGDALTYQGHAGGVNAVAWSPNGRQIVSGASDNTAQVWNASAGTPDVTYRGHTDIVLAVAWSPDGKRIASASRDATVQVWDAESGRTSLVYEGHTDAVNAVAWSPDGQRIVSASDDSTVQVWRAV